MRTVNVHEAKTHLSRFLTEVEDGGEVIIARAGKPVAKLVAVRGVEASRPSRLGGLENEGFRWDEAAWSTADQQALEASFNDEPLDDGRA